MIGEYRKKQLARQLMENYWRDDMRVLDIDELLWVDAVNWYIENVECTCQGMFVDEACWNGLTDDERIDRLLVEVQVRVQL